MAYFYEQSHFKLQIWIILLQLSKVTIEKYGKTTNFSRKQHFNSYFRNPSKNSDKHRTITLAAMIWRILEHFRIDCGEKLVHRMIHQRVDVLEWTQTETGTMSGAVSTFTLRRLVSSADRLCSLNPDQARPIVDKLFDTLMVFLIFFWKKLILKRISR